MKGLFKLVFFVFPISVFGQVNLDNGLVGYFPLDGNTSDMSSLSIDGLNYGAISTQDGNGQNNAAMHFLNNSREQLAKMRALDKYSFDKHNQSVIEVVSPPPEV